MTIHTICVLLLIIYWAVYAGINLVKHGEPQTVSPLKLFLSQTFAYTLLIVGGFFTVLHWPQLFLIISSALAWGMFVSNGFEPIKTNYSFFLTIVTATISWIVLYCGGFWF